MQIHSTLSEVRKFLAAPVTATLTQIKKLAGVKSHATFTDIKRALLSGPPAPQPVVFNASTFIPGFTLIFSLTWDGTEAQAAGAKFEIYIDNVLLGSLDAYQDDGHDQRSLSWPDLAPGTYVVSALWRKGGLVSPRLTDSEHAFTLIVS